MPSLQIGSRTFRDIDSYNSAKRDYIKIEELRASYDLTSIESVRKLIGNIEAKKIHFDSLLGEDFLEELEELLKQLESEIDNNTSSRRRLSKKVMSDRESALNISTDRSATNEKDVRRGHYKDKGPEKGLDRKTDDAIGEADEQLQLEIKRQLKKKEARRKLTLAILALVAMACISYLIFYYFMYLKNDVQYNELSSLVKEKTIGEEQYSVNIIREDDSTPPILKKYETIYQKNKKIVGWLKIEGTNIDYPVMQTVNNEYYLDHNYNQEYDKNGSIFLDKDCDAAHPGDNMIIYGHHMKSGKMFGNLNLYSREDYYKEHPSISFDTIYEEGTYDVMYVFRSKIYSEEEIVFKYYKFINATSEAEFDSNMEEMEKLSLYDTGIRAKYGDKLITLSTCDSSESNGRFVVVAKKAK